MSSLAWPNTASAPHPGRLAEIAADLVKRKVQLAPLIKGLRVGLLHEAVRITGSKSTVSTAVIGRLGIFQKSITDIQKLRPELELAAEDMNAIQEMARVLLCQGLNYHHALEAAKKAVVRAAIGTAGGNDSEAARILGCHRGTVRNFKR